MRITAETPVGELIARHPSTIQVFQVHHVVICCSPGRRVGEAAERFGADPVALVGMLERVAAQEESAPNEPAAAPAAAHAAERSSTPSHARAA